VTIQREEENKDYKYRQKSTLRESAEASSRSVIVKVDTVTATVLAILSLVNNNVRLDCLVLQSVTLSSPAILSRWSHSMKQAARCDLSWVSLVAKSLLLRRCCYRAMHVMLARYCYRKSSVRPSVRPSVRLSVTLMYREHIGWTSSKLI